MNRWSKRLKIDRCHQSVMEGGMIKIFGYFKYIGISEWMFEAYAKGLYGFVLGFECYCYSDKEPL